MVAESLRVNGEYRPVVANPRTGGVLAGQSHLAAATHWGGGELAVSWVTSTMLRRLGSCWLTTRSSDLAGYDDVPAVGAAGDAAEPGRHWLCPRRPGGSAAVSGCFTVVVDGPVSPPQNRFSRRGSGGAGAADLVCGDAQELESWRAVPPGQLLLSANRPYGSDTRGMLLREARSGASAWSATLWGQMRRHCCRVVPRRLTRLAEGGPASLVSPPRGVVSSNDMASPRWMSAGLVRLKDHAALVADTIRRSTSRLF